LLIGLLPETVDYSDPALPQGMNAKKIRFLSGNCGSFRVCR
jgi:hypothetical protein